MPNEDFTFSRWYGFTEVEVDPNSPGIAALAASMIASSGSPEDRSPDAAMPPAAYTFFGQFLAHDLVRSNRDTHSGTPPDNPGSQVSGLFDLDHFYGPRLTPEDNSWLFESDAARFIVGKTRPNRHPNDLWRRWDGTARLVETRNDENLLLSQMTLLFIKFHNFVVGEIEAGRHPDFSPEGALQLFEHTRLLLTWHYQWIIVHEYLPEILDPVVFEEERQLMEQTARETPRVIPASFRVPMEFAFAAFRFGHSTVRDSYQLNRRHPNVSLKQLFSYTGLKLLAEETLFGVAGGLPDDRIVDWRLFLNLGETEDYRGNRSRPIDTTLARGMTIQLPGALGLPGGLALRNLQAGARFRLATGQEVAAQLPDTRRLTPDAILETSTDPEMLREHRFHVHTPLWYYVLKEAELLGGGARLGPVGSRIVARVFAGSLLADAKSYLRYSPDWRPALPRLDDGDFTLADVVRNVGDAAPPWDR